MWEDTLLQLDQLNPAQAGYTIPAQPAPVAVPPMAVPAQGGIGGLLSSLRQPTQGFENIPQAPEPTWRDRISTILSPALMQIGAALMSPPAQRAAILGNLGTTVQAGQKALHDSALYRAELAAWQRVNTQQARSPSEIELFLARPDLYEQYKGIQTKKDQKNYRAYTIGTDGQPNLIYEGPEQPTIHNTPQMQKETTHVLIPHDADVSKLNLGPNVVPHVMPPPQKQQAVWHPSYGVNEKGEMVPGKINSITGEFVANPTVYQPGKAVPGKKQGRLSGQIQGASEPVIPGISDVNVGNPNDWTPNPTPVPGQYKLPKNGVMVPVDKATYDAYQRKWGLPR